MLLHDPRFGWIVKRVCSFFSIQTGTVQELLSDPNNIRLIEGFLNDSDPHRLIFSYQLPVDEHAGAGPPPAVMIPRPPSSAASKVLHVSGDSVIIRNKALYLLRTTPGMSADMAVDCCSGELHPMILDCLQATLQDVYLPYLRSNQDWGLCPREQ